MQQGHGRGGLLEQSGHGVVTNFHLRVTGCSSAPFLSKARQRGLYVRLQDAIDKSGNSAHHTTPA